MKQLLFGPAGIPKTARSRSSEDGIRRVRELGLGCMELEFVQRVSMGEDTARSVRQAAKAEGIRLTVHAPYYVNLNAKDAAIVTASRERILKSARIGALAGAESVAIHAAFYHDDPPNVVYERVKQHFIELAQQLRAEGVNIALRPETMGKATQFGTVEEVLALSREVDGVAPCIDFAHLHARTGACNSDEGFAAVFEQVRKALGRKSLAEMHIHVSGIDYGPKGERKHLNFKEADFRYRKFLRAAMDYNVKGFIICESPILEKDAVLLQKAYRALERAARSED